MYSLFSQRHERRADAMQSISQTRINSNTKMSIKKYGEFHAFYAKILVCAIL